MKEVSSFDRPNVLVAGGAGFIGSNLCEQLVQTYNVICVDNFSSGHESSIDHLLSNPHFELIRHDIREPLDFKHFKGLERFRIAFVGVQHVVHAACPGSPNSFLTSPIDMITAQSAGTRNLLELAVSFRSRFLLVSDAVAGTDVSEKDPQYRLALSKRFAEMLVGVYTELYSLEAQIARLHACYGPSMYLEDTRLVPFLIARALRNEELVLPGHLEKGAFLSVQDACDALEKLLVAEKRGSYELGATAMYTLQEVAEKILAHTGSSSRITLGTQQDAVSQLWEVTHAPADISALKKETGWFPVVLLDDGLEKTVQYMKSLRGVKRATA